MNVPSGQAAALEEQRARLMQFVALNAHDAVSRRTLALTLRDLGQPRAALSWLREAVGLCPTYAEAWLDLGHVLEALGDRTGAGDAYARAVEAAPGFMEAGARLMLLAPSSSPAPWPAPRRPPSEIVVEHGAGEAEVRAALAADRSDGEALVKLALLLLQQNRIREAELFAQHVLGAWPDDVTAGLVMVSALQMRGDGEQAATRLLTIADRAPQHAVAGVLAYFAAIDGVHWTRLQERRARAAAAVRAQPLITEPMDCAYLGFSAAEIAAVADAFAQRYSAAPRQGRRRGRGERIAVGYISADFHDHPVGRIAAELMAAHDRTRFTVTGYSLWPAADAVRSRIVAACDDFADLYGADADSAAARIDVDVLVDLTGYTRNNRADVLARRPAPVQVNYLGFPGTMGQGFMDVLLADAFVAGNLPIRERVVCLPGCLLPAFGYRGVPPAPMTRAEFGLPAAGAVFCNFGETRRVTPEVFGLWMALLKRVPGSVLWLAQPPGNAAMRLRIAAVEHGVGAHRLHFAPRQPVEQYLARYAAADVFLDTMPVNAQSTAADALWMGCPVVTRPGDIYPGRVAASLVRAAGLASLVAEDDAAYVAIAAAAAQDARLRAHLLAQRSTNALFKPDLFVRQLEDVYAELVQSTR